MQKADAQSKSPNSRRLLQWIERICLGALQPAAKFGQELRNGLRSGRVNQGPHEKRRMGGRQKVPANVAKGRGAGFALPAQVEHQLRRRWLCLEILVEPEDTIHRMPVSNAAPIKAESAVGLLDDFERQSFELREPACAANHFAVVQNGKSLLHGRAENLGACLQRDKISGRGEKSVHHMTG